MKAKKTGQKEKWLPILRKGETIHSKCGFQFRWTDKEGKRHTIHAKEKGRRIGRPQTTKDDIPAIFYKHYPSFTAGRINVSEFARLCSLSRPSIYKYLKMVE